MRSVIYARPKPQRRSGEGRSPEPIATNLSDQNHDPGVWIPGSGLRPAPE